MDNLNEVTNDQLNQPRADRKFFSISKIIFAVLGIVVLIEVGYVIKTLVIPSSTPLPAPTPQATVQLTGGRISLTVPQTSYKVNEVIPVSVTINTGGRLLDGVDLIVRYDPKIVEATQAGLIKGKVFDEYPFMAIDKNSGLISISGINNKKNGFVGGGLFATINLKAKALGKTSLTVNFKKGSTTESNLVETATSKNILEQVDNLELIVK